MNVNYARSQDGAMELIDGQRLIFKTEMMDMDTKKKELTAMEREHILEQIDISSAMQYLRTRGYKIISPTVWEAIEESNKIDAKTEILKEEELQPGTTSCLPLSLDGDWTDRLN